MNEEENKSTKTQDHSCVSGVSDLVHALPLLLPRRHSDGMTTPRSELGAAFHHYLFLDWSNLAEFWFLHF